MKVYEIYEHPERGRRAVKVGFSWPGFSFSPLWALSRKLWLTAILLILSAYPLGLLEDYLKGFSITAAAVGVAGIQCIIVITIGLYGNRLIEKSLSRRGYQLISRIAASSRGDALRRFEESPASEEPILSPIRKYGPLAFVAVACGMALILRATVVAFYMPSPSMLNTLKINDRVFVNRFAYTFSQPKIGDLIVFYVPETIPDYDPNKPIWIKRIVGLEGDHVTIEDRHLRVNGQAVDDPPFLADNVYESKLANGKVFEGVTVGEDEILVFGDNSGNSYDSRYWGTIPAENIVGKVVFRFWPLNRMGEIRGVRVRPFED